MARTADEMIETERKYRVGPGFTVPGLAGVAGTAEVTPPQRYRLTAIYYDTPDQALARAHITLRRRTGGEDPGWHLKLPAGGQSRREIHAPLGRRSVGVPPRLLAEVSRWAGQEPLRPVARLRTSRTVRRLLKHAHGAGGAERGVLAEVADDRVTGSVPADGGDAWQTVARWREVEVELVHGTAELLGQVGARLAEVGATPSASASKLSRVLAAAGRYRH
jgi:inorganic triphosphatase YgiF